MEHLQEELDALLRRLPNEQEVRDRLDSLVSVYPFNEYEYIISTLLAMDVLSLDDYHELRDNYVETNPYYSRGQHRGNVGEGQLHVKQDKIDEFSGTKLSQTNSKKRFVLRMTDKSRRRDNALMANRRICDHELHAQFVTSSCDRRRGLLNHPRARQVVVGAGGRVVRSSCPRRRLVACPRAPKRLDRPTSGRGRRPNDRRGGKFSPGISIPLKHR